MTNEQIIAVDALFRAAGAKAKAPAEIIKQLESEQVTVTVEGGLAVLMQGGQPANAGQVIAAFRTKYPRMFYGEAGEVRYKSDLKDDLAAKVRWIAEHSLAEWEALPYDAQSATAKNVVTDQIPSEAMTREQYMRLSIPEKAKVAGELGPRGIEKIMARHK